MTEKPSTASVATPTNPADLLRSALAGVLRRAQTGELPPFVATLGLPGAELLQLVRYVFSATEVSRYMLQNHAALLAETPPLVEQLVDLMLVSRSAGADEQQARWLAHAVAAASFGERHLWEDLGVSGREVVSALLRHYFEPLYQRNTRNLKWKRFIYDELGDELGQHDLRPSGCGHCDQFTQCYPPVPVPHAQDSPVRTEHRCMRNF
ncbi:MAG: nitrogen fixation protein NifQ [Pseudomonadota bacterium]